MKIKDPLKWVAAACALVATASAEYELARAIGMNPWVALAVPGALDAYVVRALRAHREVLTSVLAMVGVNAVSHLLTAGVLVLDWRIITAVSAIAPLVLWRVHALGTPGEWRVRKTWGRSGDDHERDTDEHGEPGREHPEPWIDEHADTPREAQAQTCSRGCTVWGDLGAHERAHELAGWTVPEHADTPCLLCETTDHCPQHCACDDCSPSDTQEHAITDTATCSWCGWTECPAHLMELHKKNTCVKRFEHGPDSFDAHVATVPGVSDLTVPEAWTRDTSWDTFNNETLKDGHTVPVSIPTVLPTDPFPEDTPERAQACAVVSLPLPAGFEHAVPSEADTAKAIEHGEWYEEYVSKHGSTPSLRTVKAECSVSTDRARRLLNIWGDA